MAYIKILPIKSNEHLSNALEYILRKEKTKDGELVDSFYCQPDWAIDQFEYIRAKKVIEKGNNIAWQLYQSFAFDDDVTPEKALEMGKELMKRFYPDFQYIIATHIDKDYLHNHILINSVDFKTYHKLHSNKQTLAQLRAVANDISLENSLSVIDQDGTLFQRRDLRETAFTAIENYFSKAYNFIKRKCALNSKTVNIPVDDVDEYILNDEERQAYNKNILDNLDKIEDSTKRVFDKYISVNAAEIKDKTSLNKSEFSDFLYGGTERAFEKFSETENKRKKPSKPEALKKNLQSLIFTAIEQVYNNIPKVFNHKYRLRKNLDKAIQEAADYDSFIGLMQEAGYEVKFGGSKKGLAFKDSRMERFMYAKSISLDYTESMIKYRIKNRKEPPEAVKKRTVYDDKIKVRSKRKRLRIEIDASIKKSNSFEEFISDMQRKNFEVKLGKHIAFRDSNLFSDGKQHSFLRSESLGSHYTENVIKFRIEHKERYKNIMDDKVEKIIPITERDDGELASWKRGNNAQIRENTEMWVDRKLKQYAINNGYDVNDYKPEKLAPNEKFGYFLEEYEKQKDFIASRESEINKIDSVIYDIQKHIKAIDNYWNLKPQLIRYKDMDINSFSDSELTEYKSFVSKWRYTTGKLESAKANYGTLSTKELKFIINGLTEDRQQLQEEAAELKLDFETWENVKYNFEVKEGYNYAGKATEISKKVWAQRKADDARKHQQKAEKEENKEARKGSVRKFFGLSK